jgi:hypothetical protein
LSNISHLELQRATAVQELEERLPIALNHLEALLPEDYGISRLQSVLTQAPTLIFRMDYYHDARHLSDLPTDFRDTLLGM